MNYYVLLIALVGGVVFFLLKPTSKAWLAFFIMTSCFDLVPRVISDKEIWDLGIILFMIVWIQLLFVNRVLTVQNTLYIKIIKAFVVWMLICFIWSIIMYEYSPMLTIKASRQMVLGYLSFFILIRLFESYDNALQIFIKSFYLLTYVLLVVSIVQFIVNKQILFGHFSPYGEDIRFLPIFLPFAHLFMWQHLARLLSGAKIRVSGILFIILALFVTLITFTRGIYFAVLLSSCLLMAALFFKSKLSLIRVSMVSFCAVLGVAALFSAGSLDKFIERATSGLNLIVSDSLTNRKKMDDTFTGRMALTGERFQMVMQKNPVFGFGFVHEDIVQDSLRPKFRYGSVVSTKKYLERYKFSNRFTLALHSADVGWPNIAIDTGFVGLFLFVALLISIFIHYFRDKTNMDEQMSYLRLAFFVQIFTLVFLMFNGNPYVNLVHIPCFMLAGYSFCSAQKEPYAGNDSYAVV